MTPPDPSSTAKPPHPLIVALAAWALPGLGYVLIGHRARGLTVGVTIVLLFVGGLLIGGIRSLEVPMVEREDVQIARIDAANPRPERAGTTTKLPPVPAWGDEIRAKPWSIAQFFNGPMGFVGAYFSSMASTVDVTKYLATRDTPQPEIVTPGVESHARVNEIAVLYTAVAGMLNLLAIIDSAHRAGRMLEDR